MTPSFENLPDPRVQPEFYADVTFKRLLAWIADAILISLLTVVFVLFTAFTALLVIGFVTLTISLLYRWLTISAWSATPGMRLVSIQLRNHRGEKLDAGTAFVHSALFLVLKSFVIPQLISIAMMLFTERGQSLHDAFTGVVALNRYAPHGLSAKRAR